jgi:uncharacterized protein DUF2585
MLDGFVPPLLVAGTGFLLVWFRQVYGERLTFRWRRWIIDLGVIAAVVCLAAFLELAMGRAPTYEHGPIRPWSGDISSDQNSQQLFDPYSFTHAIHGAAFYGLTRLVLGPVPFGLSAIIAITLEAAWEVYENTDQVINRYRAETISLGYRGDSILNSLADILACVVGLLLARRLPAVATVSWVIAVELILALWIRDNLTLNIIMLIHPIDAIKAWQAGV